MTDFQSTKRTVLDFYAALEGATSDDVAGVISEHTTDGFDWRGTHPFEQQHGADAVAEAFWIPLLKSFERVQRRMDIFLAGANADDDGATEWVCSMGHLMGLFDRTFLGIPPTGKMSFIRYAEFDRVEDGRVAETVLFCDLLALMQQAGVYPLPQPTGAPILTPGPRTHDGLNFDASDPDQGIATRELIARMVDHLIKADLHSSQSELASTWHDDMIWWGPAGIGATYTLPRYELQHQGPFDAGLTDIKSCGHQCTLAEGGYGGFFGWPSLTARPTGGFLGLPASDRSYEMRVVDLYRREGARLAENWIFIDLPWFLHQQGLDVFARMHMLASSSIGAGATVGATS